MADYSDFTSVGGLYDFSKGPKGIYYAKGDENLFGVVLNVPQTDDDDEWGGTERIALERISDEIGALQEYVLDPAGGGNGLTTRVAALETVVDVTNDTVSVGNITLTGSTDTITIGSDAALLDGDTLRLGGTGAFMVDEISANRYDITFKDVDIRMSDDGVTRSLTVMVGSTSYVFGASELTVADLSITGDLTLTGDISATNLTLTGDLTGVKDIGTMGAYMETLYVDTISGTTICGTAVNTGPLQPLAASTHNIGAPANRYNAIAARDLNMGDVVSPTFTVDGTTGNIVTAGDISGADMSMTAGTIVTLTAGSATICGNLVAGDAAADLGQPAIPGRWANVYGVDGSFSGDVAIGGDITAVDNVVVGVDVYTTGWSNYISSSTLTGWASPGGQIMYKKIGKTVIVHFNVSSLGDVASTAAKFTVPYAADATVAGHVYYVAIRTVNNGTPDTSLGAARFSPSTDTTLVECVRDPSNNPATGDWSGAGVRSVTGTLIYEAA